MLYAASVILNSILKTGNFSQCLLERLYYEHGQQYIVKNQRIYLTNPKKTNSLIKKCPGIGNTSDPVEVGFNMYPARRGCHYETSELSIYIGNDVATIKDQEDDDEEITLIEDLSKAEELLGPRTLPNKEEDTFHTLIEKYKNDSKLNGKAISQLEQEMRQLDSIQTIADYNPMKLDLLNPKHIGNWITGILWFCVLILVFIILNCIDWIIPGSIKKRL